MSERKEKVLSVALFIVALAVLGGLDSCAGEGHPGGVRGTLSADWHHAKCFLRMCDEDGRCPVWSSKYSKCYMLDGAGVKELDAYVKFGCTRKEYEKRELCF